MTMRVFSELKKWCSSIIILILWQAGSTLGIIPSQILCGPNQIVRTCVSLLLSGELLQDIYISLLRALAGLALGLLAGTLLSLVSSLFPWGESIIDIPVQMARSLPFLGLAPLFILWFGIGEVSKVALGAFFPVYINLFARVHSTDNKLLESCKLLGLSRWQRVWHVVLPSTLPSFLVGLRYAFSIAWLSLVVAEQVNADSRIGYLVMQAREYMRTDTMVLGLAIYALLGWISHAFVQQLETRLLSWRPAIAR